jgi:hypothetical protein
MMATAGFMVSPHRNFPPLGPMYHLPMGHHFQQDLYGFEHPQSRFFHPYFPEDEYGVQTGMPISSHHLLSNNGNPNGDVVLGLPPMARFFGGQAMREVDQKFASMSNDQFDLKFGPSYPSLPDTQPSMRLEQQKYAPLPSMNIPELDTRFPLDQQKFGSFGGIGLMNPQYIGELDSKFPLEQQKFAPFGGIGSMNTPHIGDLDSKFPLEQQKFGSYGGTGIGSLNTPHIGELDSKFPLDQQKFGSFGGIGPMNTPHIGDLESKFSKKFNKNP